MTSTNGGTVHDIGVGLISIGWMGKPHTRAYQVLLPAVSGATFGGDPAIPATARD
jgi:hypothetical protein